MVGASPQEQDTIPGRQCMASCFFMLRQFDDVMIYLKSIQQFFEADDDFIWNYAITLAATGDYKQAEEYFLKIQSEKYRLEDCYNRWLTRCYIMNGKTNLAWELYVNMETNNESIYLL
jgi:intraflagellar transport protein 56